MRRTELHHALRLLGAIIFDILGFVQHDRRPIRRPEFLGISTSQLIRCQDDVACLVLLQEALVAVAVAPMMHVQAQSRSKTGELALPVAQQRGWANDQAFSPRLRGVIQQHGDDLDRFSQAHIVGQQGAEPELAHCGQPLVSPLLIGPQRPVQPGGHRPRPRLTDRSTGHQQG
ncbi:hypothetical protein D3C74_284160 [compost metagenome]